MLIVLLSACGTSTLCTLPWSCPEADHPRAGWHLLAMQPSAIYEIDQESGAASIFSETDWGSSGMFTADVRADGVPFSSSETLYEVDHCQGARTEIAHLSTRVQGMAFDGEERLLGLSREDDTVYEIDTETGALTALAELGFDIGHNGMAYDFDQDIVYGLDADSGRLFTLDPLTGSVGSAVTAQIGDPLAYVGMEYSPADGNLWVSSGTDLYAVAPQTGASRWIGDHGVDGINDLALFPPCE